MVYTVKTYSSGTMSVWKESNEEEEEVEEEEGADPQSPEGWSNIKCYAMERRAQILSHDVCSTHTSGKV